MQRITTRSQFQKALANHAVNRTAHFALHRGQLVAVAISNLSEPKIVFSQIAFPVRDVWMGALVPKRWAKRAVTRNMIKRLIHDVAAESGQALPIAAYVVRMRAGFDRAVFPSATSAALKIAVRTEVQQLLESVPEHTAASAAKGAPG